MEEEKNTDNRQEPDKDTALDLDEQAMLQVLIEANAIERGRVTDTLTIGGKRWRLRPTAKWQNRAMLDHDYDVMYWQSELRDCKSRRRARRLNGKIARAYARKAAHRWLGHRLALIPGAFLYAWLRLYLADERVSASINAADAVSEKQSFYLANLGSSKRALGLSTMQVGNAVRQLRERQASAESMLDEDASPKSQEDSKSPARSKRRPTTRG